MTIVKHPTNLEGIASLEGNIPEAVGQSVTPLHAFRTVVVEVVSLDIYNKMRVAEIVEVTRMMNPLLDNVAFDHASQQSRQSIYGREEAD